jgi:hypothetical protein
VDDSGTVVGEETASVVVVVGASSVTEVLVASVQEARTRAITAAQKNGRGRLFAMGIPQPLPVSDRGASTQAATTKPTVTNELRARRISRPVASGGRGGP